MSKPTKKKPNGRVGRARVEFHADSEPANVGAKCTHGTHWGYCRVTSCEGYGAMPIMTEEGYQRVVGALIGHFRRHRSWTQGQLAKRLGCEQSQLSRIEDGQASPTIYQVARLTAIFKCKVSDIIIDLGSKS